MEINTNIVNIFWTGGLDSTFRLIQLLNTTNNKVQPHYIVRHENSTGIEIYTMIRIRREIIRQYPQVRDRFLPTLYTNEDLIPRFEETSTKVDELRKIAKVREQYHILSDYCNAFKIDSIELSLVRSTGETMFINNFSSSSIFKNFKYPNKDFSKKELYNIAKEKGWHKILLMTSFCRRPKLKISQCGLCGPCADSVMSGMGFRLPWFAYLKAKAQIPFRKYWRNNYLRQEETRFFRMIKSKFEGKL